MLYFDLYSKIPAAFRALIDCSDPVMGFVVGEFVHFPAAIGMDAAADLDIVFSVVVRQSSFVNRHIFQINVNLSF